MKLGFNLMPAMDMYAHSFPLIHEACRLPRATYQVMGQNLTLGHDAPSSIGSQHSGYGICNQLWTPSVP